LILVHSGVINSLINQSGNDVIIKDFLLAEEISVEDVFNAFYTV